MRQASAALVAFLNAARPTGDVTFYRANLFTVTLASGVVLTYTDIDVPVAWNGRLFAANSLRISGLKYRCAMGLDVDTQQITLTANPTDLYGGAPFLQALQQGLFDGAEIQRELAFFSGFPAGVVSFTPIGATILFKGRVASIDKLGRTTAEITVSSDLVLLDIDMPRNLYQTNCGHVLYDQGCGVSRAAFTTTGTVMPGSVNNFVKWTGANQSYVQGSIRFTSGLNAGSEATIKYAGDNDGVVLVYPLENVPQAGDGFTICQGCDHTMATCKNKFNNLGRFRGFPFVPPPQIITGPMATVYTTGGGK